MEMYSPSPRSSLKSLPYLFLPWLHDLTSDCFYTFAPKSDSTTVRVCQLYIRYGRYLIMPSVFNQVYFLPKFLF